jgi:inhibitor of KinA
VPLLHIHPYNEVSLLLQFPGQTLEKAHENVQHWFAFAKQYWMHCLTDLIPAYDSLLLICKSPGYAQQLQYDLLDQNMQVEMAQAAVSKEPIIIPVCYDAALGNDLEVMAMQHKISVESIVQIHLQQMYHVYMLGFLPGFAYMGEVDARIATPRKPSPVPTRAGAVGIAGKQTGIYPLNSPGGWNIVGYTPLKMFDIQQASPSFLQQGQLVKFSPIDLETYQRMIENSDGNH